MEAETLDRVKGEKRVLADYQKIFDIYDKETKYDVEGASEDQIDDRIQDLSLIFSGKVLNAKGEAAVLSEALRQQSDFTRRVEGIYFLRSRKRRQALDDGVSDE